MAKIIESVPILHGAQTKTVQAGRLPDTPLETINSYLKELKDHQLEWAQSYPIAKRIELLEKTLTNIDKYKEEWGKADLLARQIPEGHFSEPDSFIAGPAVAARIIRVFNDTLRKIEKNGGYKPFAKARQDGNRVIVDCFPLHAKEKLLLPGFRGEIHLAEGTKTEDIPSLQAKFYKDKTYEGGVSLVLAAGNISSLTISDLFHKLMVEKKVVIVKAHPVLEYMGPLLEKVMEPFITAGFVRVVNGGAREGQHLVTHPLIDDIHLTGSDKTFEAIVYGRGPEGDENKKNDHRINPKPVTGELGNITPVIVVPGEWKDRDFDYQADNIFSMLAFYNGYTCTTPRVLILPKSWDGSKILMEKIEDCMRKAKPAVNYYPGTEQTIGDARACYPELDQFGTLSSDTQPWMLAKDLDASKDENAFDREFWSAFLSQTYLSGDSPEEYLLNAVKFANEKLWGTLSAAIIIDPKTEKTLKANGTLNKAIHQLHYGTVALNVYPGLSQAFGSSPWGGYPGATYTDIQSGNGFVMNGLMLDKIEKSVVSAPFRISPKPIWFIEEKPNLKAVKALTDFAISNKLTDFGRLLVSVITH
jgi:hypothetical protein